MAREQEEECRNTHWQGRGDIGQWAVGTLASGLLLIRTTPYQRHIKLQVAEEIK
jgi:hypothetical protein